MSGNSLKGGLAECAVAGVARGTGSGSTNTKQNEYGKENKGTSSRKQNSPCKEHRATQNSPKGRSGNSLYRTKRIRRSGIVHREKQAQREGCARPWTGTSGGYTGELGHSGGLDRLRLLPKPRLGGRVLGGGGFMAWVLGRVVGFYT